MRRRSYLALLAASLGTGCVSDAGVGGKPDPDPPTSPERTVTETADRAEEPFESVTVGDPANVTDTETNRPHGVVVVNDGPARAISLKIERARADSDVVKPVLNDRTSSRPAGGYASNLWSQHGTWFTSRCPGADRSARSQSNGVGSTATIRPTRRRSPRPAVSRCPTRRR